MAMGDMARARRMYEQDLAIAERLAAADPGNAGAQRDLAVSYGRLADVDERDGDAERAAAGFARAYEVVSGVFGAEDPRSRYCRERLERLRDGEGEDAEAAGG